MGSVRDYRAIQAYTRSKAANILFKRELQRFLGIEFKV
jgi:hypothetical protein